MRCTTSRLAARRTGHCCHPCVERLRSPPAAAAGSLPCAHAVHHGAQHALWANAKAGQHTECAGGEQPAVRAGHRGAVSRARRGTRCNCTAPHRAALGQALAYSETPCVPPQCCFVCLLGQGSSARARAIMAAVAPGATLVRTRSIALLNSQASVLFSDTRMRQLAKSGAHSSACARPSPRGIASHVLASALPGAGVWRRGSHRGRAGRGCRD